MYASFTPLGEINTIMIMEKTKMTFAPKCTYILFGYALERGAGILMTNTQLASDD